MATKENVNAEVSQLLRDKHPCPNGPCDLCGFTNIQPDMLRSAFNGEYLVYILRPAPQDREEWLRQ